MAGRVITVAGAKGGVGKTTTSVNLAAALADHGHAVVVVELDLAMANLADFLDIDLETESAPTFHEVLAGEARLVDAVRTDVAGFDVLPSGLALETYVTADMRQVERIVGTLRNRYDVVVLDTMAGLSDETILPLELADGVVLVSTPYRASVRDARKTKQLTDRIGTPIIGIVFTKAGSAPGPSPERIAEHLGVTHLGTVPDDRTVPASQFEGEPVVDWAPEGDAGAAYRRIGATLSERLASIEPTPRAGLQYATDELTSVTDLIEPIEEDDEFWWGVRGEPDTTADRPDGSEAAGTAPRAAAADAGTEPAQPAGDAEPEPDPDAEPEREADPEAATEEAPGEADEEAAEEGGKSSLGARIRSFFSGGG